MRLSHTFEPVFNQDSRVLILGTFPSVKSRQTGFYYGHPMNRFWAVMAGLTGCPIPVSVPEKRDFLLQNRIALWDTVQSCDITGSGDERIKNVVPSDLSALLDQSGIEGIYANGKKAACLYKKLTEPKTGRSILALPSTSPRNAGYSLEKLIAAWSVILL
jgi:hypoxanthine-DNA glycosylase